METIPNLFCPDCNEVRPFSFDPVKHSIETRAGRLHANRRALHLVRCATAGRRIARSVDEQVPRVSRTDA